MNEGERDRLLARVRHLAARYVEPARLGARSPVELAIHPVHGEPVSYADGTAGPWSPFRAGERWGGRWDTAWFRLRGQVPPQWRGERVDLLVDLGFRGQPGFGAEGLLWRGGVPLAAVNSRHREIRLLGSAGGGEAVELFLEAAANPVGGGEDLLAPDYGGNPQLRFERAELAVRDRAITGLYVDLMVLTELAADLPVNERRTGGILAALRAAVAALDPADLGATAEAARAILAEQLSLPASAGAHHISAVGHAHIDCAWLWPIRETVRKCARTFATAVALLDDYPQHTFACSQAQQHAWIRDQYPELFARMQDHAAKGRFEPIGSMWVEPDCNLPGGEALVRHFLYGKRFFLEAYGIETAECWLPDAFGYPASFPQIMAKAGVKAFISQKLSWNDTNQYPHHTFWWEGIDGTRVIAHFPPAGTYNGDFSVAELRRSARDFSDHPASGVSLYPFGYGDGGGGPTEEMLQRAERVADLAGMPRVTTGAVAGFLSRVLADGASLESWAGELYLEYHRGTYTSQARTKAANRRCESALYEADLWSVFLGPDQAARARAALGAAWRSMLLHQFHDILPGSSINWVYRDTAAAHRQILATGEQIVTAATSAMAASVNTAWARQPLFVTNASAHARREVIMLPAALGASLSEGSPAVLAGPDGEVSSIQRAAGGEWLAQVDVPSCGWATYDVRAGKARPADAVIAEPGRLENSRLRVTLDRDGLISSIYDKLARREVIAPGERGNLLRLHDDEPADFDAWNIDEFYADRTRPLTGADSIEVVESGPLRGAIRIRRRFGSSALSQTIRLETDSARLDFVTDVDWHERHRLLRVTFPVAVRSQHASYEIQFGHVERPTHANTSWDKARFEVCAHRWADLSEPGYGVALLNDSKYGYRVSGHRLELSLLRSPTAPDPEADQGSHHFVYSLLPHEGDLRQGAVAEAGWNLNQPLRAIAAEPGIRGPRAPRQSAVTFDRPGVALSAIKYAEDSDDIIVRFYERDGSRGPVSLHIALPVSSVVRTDLLEREIEPVRPAAGDLGTVIDLTVDPFEIVTLRLHAP